MNRGGVKFRYVTLEIYRYHEQRTGECEKSKGFAVGRGRDVGKGTLGQSLINALKRINRANR